MYICNQITENNGTNDYSSCLTIINRKSLINYVWYSYSV